MALNKRWWWLPVLALVAGLLMVCPMVWTPAWLLTPIGLALFFGLVEIAPTWRWAALCGYMAGLGITIVGFYWLNYVVVVYGGVPLGYSLLVFLLFSIVFGMKLPLLAILLRVARQRAPARVFWTWPLAVATTELTPLALFPWYFGNFQTGNLWLLQMADIVGVAGVAYPLAVVGMLLYEAVRRPPVPRPAWLFAALLLVVWYGYGILRMQQVDALQATAPVLRISVVQPDTPLRSDDPMIAVKILERCRSLSVAQQGRNPDLVVWPEGGTPFSFDTRQQGADVYFHRIATQVATTLHAQLIFNEDVYRNDKVFNAATLLDRQGTRVGSYDKIYLLAFGEYMPLANTFPVLRQFGIYDLTPGTDIKVLPLDNGMKVAPQVCYEILFPGFTRQFMQKGADLIVNLTDDAWFGPTLASLEHLHDLLPRAIENRVPLVRCTNSGISTVIAPTGRYEAPLTPLFQPAAFSLDVPVAHIPTFYTHWGDVFCYACALVLAGLLTRH